MSILRRKEDYPFGPQMICAPQYIRVGMHSAVNQYQDCAYQTKIVDLVRIAYMVMNGMDMGKDIYERTIVVILSLSIFFD